MSFELPETFDVAIVGAGHAGIEAASAAARLGCRVVVLSQNLDTIGQMSCNPAIGGLAKGQIVREIDALGGFMGLNADATAIQFRLLNASKGPSVRAPRAQCDKKAYQFRAKAVLEATPGVRLLQGNVTRILVADDKATGVETNLGLMIRARSIVVTTGTFMRGLLHIGPRNEAGGRMGDAPSTLSDSLKDLGFEISRFKTGTPCRINGRSIDFTKCERQPGDPTICRFSFQAQEPSRRDGEVFTLNYSENGLFHVEQVPCWITRTTPETHSIIRSSLHESPMFTGQIKGVGPRYCPSIEDKVVRFSEKDHHQVFLEPEGLHTSEFYVNGVSTSLPLHVQYAFIHSIPGLELAEIIRPGYAVEYDFCPPTQLLPTLETKRIQGLYFAGQINGTSGYEEAAGQGLVAGANCALKLQGKSDFILSRQHAYIGVMIDDLVTKGVTEPYRMFSSRAEYRLNLRHDTAELRLAPIAHHAGLLPTLRWNSVAQKIAHLDALNQLADSLRVEGITLGHVLRQKEGAWRSLPHAIVSMFPAEIWDIFENNIRYEGYLKRQQEFLSREHSLHEISIPAEFDFSRLIGLRAEARQRLTSVLPRNLGQASRISGITPADIAVLAIELRKSARAKTST